MYRYKKKSGQHTMEYVIMLTLIMAALLVMGPYVIRSWNAQMKGWEDTMIDSLQDPLKESNDEIDISMCECTDWTNNDYNLCGASCPVLSRTCMASCSKVKMLSLRTCVPPGCEIFDVKNPKRDLALGICDFDSCCCEDPQAVEPINDPTGCGPNVKNYNIYNTTNNCWIPPKELPIGSGKFIYPTNPDGSCLDGYRGYWTFCGADDQTDDSQKRFGCIADTTCVFKCGTSTSPSGQWKTPFNMFVPDALLKLDISGKQSFCTGTDLGLTLMETEYAAINEEDSCDTTGNTKCQIKCVRPFEVDSTKTACVCPTGYVTNVQGDQCVCPTNYAEQKGCLGNQCAQATSCSDGSNPIGKCFKWQ